ncbi:MAG: four helix bundle protein [Patescibacteria group bacterium]
MLKPQLKSQNDLRTRAYSFSLTLLKFTEDFPNRRTFWVVGDQLLRSGTSIGANIIEAKAASSRRDFIRFYEIALKSANETKYWLSLLCDSKLIDPEKVKPILGEAEEIAKMLGASIITLKGKRQL